MILLKEILKEAIPYDSIDRVRRGLVNKHGSQELDSYTFGIELEFAPERTPSEDTDEIVNLLLKSREFQDLAEEYIQEERKNLNIYWSGDVSRWNDTFGPVDPDTWEAHNPEPNETDFRDSDEFGEAHDTWLSQQKDVKWNFRGFTFSDFYDSVANDIARAGEWQNYIDPSRLSTNISDTEAACAEARRYIIRTMGEKAVDEDQATVDTWSVSPDGDNVEIRSKHLKQTDFGLVTQICKFVASQATDGGTSAHVHIGLPKDFDAFDLLAITTLVDESEVVTTVGPDRQLSSYAKLRNKLHQMLIKRIIQEPRDEKTGNVPTEFVIKNDVLKKFVSYLNKHHGTNIASIDKGTVEFRYLSSDMAENSSRFIGWIKYFIILPKIAKTKNKVVLKGSDEKHKTLVCVREPGQIRFFLNKETAKVSDLPAADIKSSAPPEETSPPLNPDPRIEKLRKLKDKLRAARNATKS